MSFFKPNRTSSATNDSSRSSNSSFFPIQAKLKVGEANDKYEKEADSIADKIANQGTIFGNTEPFFAPPPTIQRSQKPEQEVQKSEETEQIQEQPLVEKISSLGSSGDDAQPKCDDCAKNEKENNFIQTKCPKCEEKTIQQKSNTEPGSDTSGIEQKLASSKGSGQKMADGPLSEMNQSFGADFSGVRIHTGSEAVQMNKDLGARAFTNGSDVYFNEGQYNPSSNDGKHLLAHELTHTIQQKAVSENIQKADDPCARPENAEAQQDCPADEAPANAASGSQQALITEASEEPPEGTEEPDNDAQPVQNNPQAAESETPNPEDEVDNTDELETSLDEQDPETALDENGVSTEEQETNQEDGEQSELDSLTEQGNQESQRGIESGRQSTAELSEHLVFAETQKEAESQSFMVAQESLSGSVTSLQSMPVSIRFSNERMENGEKSKVNENEVQAANQQGTAFIQSLVNRTSQLSAYSSTIESRILGAIQIQKDRLSQNVAVKKAQIAMQIAQSKAAAQERATVSKASIEASYLQTALQIEIDAMLGISEMTLAKEDVLGRIDTETLTQSQRIETIYTEAIADIRSRGVTVGAEATAIGEARAITYEAGKINEWDSWYEGALTDRRAEARMKSARDVSKSYSDGLVGAANEQADAALEGKQGDLDNVQTASQQSKDGLTTLFDQLIGQLETSKDAAIQNATSTKDSAINSIDAGLARLLDSLNAQERSQFEMLEFTLNTKLASLDTVGYQSMTSQFTFLSTAIDDIQGQIGQISDLLNGQEVPNQEEMALLFSQISGSIDQGIESVIAQFDQLLSEVETAIVDNATTAESSMNTMAATAISTVIRLDEENNRSVTEITTGTTAAFTSIGAAFTLSSNTLVIDAVTQFNDIAVRMQELLVSAADSIALRFEQSANSLESSLRCSLQNLSEDITCYANEAASHEAPAWKSVVKWILIIAIVVLVTVFLGPAVIGLAGGLLGSAFAGAVVGGAIVGALAGGAIQVLNNWETNRDLGEGIGQAMALGALGGAIGGGVSAALGGTSLGVVSRFALETIADGFVELGIGMATGTFDLENFGWSMLMNVGMNLFTSGVSANSRVGRTQQRIMHGSGNVGARITGATNPFPAAPTGAAAPRSTNSEIDVDVRAPETNTRTETDAGNSANVRPNEPDVSVPRDHGTDVGGTRTETNVESSTPVRPNEGDVNAPRNQGTEAEEPRTSHRDAPEIEEGTGIVAKTDTLDGHTVKVLQDGRIMFCSTCGELRMQYAGELSATIPGSTPPKTFGQRLGEIEAMPNPQNKSAAANQLRTEMEAFRVANGSGRNSMRGEDLARASDLPEAPDGFHWRNKNGSLFLVRTSTDTTPLLVYDPDAPIINGVPPGFRLSDANFPSPGRRALAERFVNAVGNSKALSVIRALDARFPGTRMDDFVRAVETGRLQGIDDWVNFNHQKAMSEMVDTTVELREGMRLLLEDPTSTVRVGMEENTPVRPGTVDDKVKEVDITVENGGNITRSIEIRSIQADVTRPAQMSSGVTHAIDKVKSRNIDHIADPSNIAPIVHPEALIEINLKEGSVNANGGKIIYDGNGNADFLTGNGKWNPDSRNWPKNILNEFNEQIVRIQDNHLLERVTVVDRNGNVLGEYFNSGGIWGRIR